MYQFIGLKLNFKVYHFVGGGTRFGVKEFSRID